MKKLALFLLTFISIYLYGQYNSFVVYPISSGQVSATPISIPTKDGKPLKLKAKNYTLFSQNESVITNCDFLSFNNNELKVRIYYSLKLKNNNPVYGGAWLYDSNNKAIDAGYIPTEIIDKPTGSIDVTLKFNKLPVSTDYIKVMLLQNGKDIANNSFNAKFYWSNSSTLVAKVTDVAKVVDATKIIDVSNMPVTLAKADLELTAIKVSLNNFVFPYEQNCHEKVKSVYIKNIGDKESSTYILSVGYDKKSGNGYKYIEIKHIEMPALLPGVETYKNIVLPPDADNIIAKIVFDNNNSDSNSANNIMEKRCTSK